MLLRRPHRQKAPSTTTKATTTRRQDERLEFRQQRHRPVIARGHDIDDRNLNVRIAETVQDVIGDVCDLLVGKRIDKRLRSETRHQHLMAICLALDTVKDRRNEISGLAGTGCRIVEQGR